MLQRWLRALWHGRHQGRHGGQQRQRIGRYLDCVWLSAWGEERSRISSLSPTGCYIESRFTVPVDGTLIPEIIVTMPTGSVVVKGIVTDATRGIGFAVRFTDVDPETRRHLHAFVQSVMVGCPHILSGEEPV